MDIITGVILIALVGAFVGAIMINRLEFCIMSLILTFCSFVAIVKDTSIPDDMVMLFYIPVIAIGMFSVASFFKVKV